jgi:hypothetical protein
LQGDLGIDPKHVDIVQSGPNAVGNIETIRAVLRDRNLEFNECAVVSNHYHILRVQIGPQAEDLSLWVFPAEAFGCALLRAQKNELYAKAN